MGCVVRKSCASPLKTSSKTIFSKEKSHQKHQGGGKTFTVKNSSKHNDIPVMLYQLLSLKQIIKSQQRLHFSDTNHA